MKKYYCEAQKKQLEKPTEPKYVFCTTAKCFVLAENDDDARVKAAAEFRRCMLRHRRCAGQDPYHQVR